MSFKIANRLAPDQDAAPRVLSTLRLYLLAGVVLSLVVLVIKVPEAHGIGSILGFSGSILLSIWPVFLTFFLFTAGLVLTAAPAANSLAAIARVAFGALVWLRGLNWVLFPLPLFFYGYYRLAGLSLPGLSEVPEIWIFGHLTLLGALFLSGTRRLSPPKSLLAAVSVYGIGLLVFYYIPDVRTYPLALGWSETSRYYYASLFFAPRIYGRWIPLSSLHPTRYLLQSLPFLLPSLPLWFHRLWQVLLWLGFTLGGGLAVAKRIVPRRGWVRWGMAAWFALFCFQGPVYYHLMVMVILVVLGFDREKPWRSLLFVALASLWAGISRVNWFPVPGMLAVALYVLEKPYGKRTFWAYWRWPVGAVALGMPLAFGAQALYAALSGNPSEVFASSFNSPLFWYRLFPNAAYGPGIINLLITAAFPLLVVIVWRVAPRWRSWRFLRLLALLSLLAALLAAGLVVSTKIGGGDNLHNLDAFLVMLALIGAYLGFGGFTADSPRMAKGRRPLPQPLVVLAFLIPLVFAVGMVRPYPDLNFNRAWNDIQQVQMMVDRVLADGGEVLFIQQRHLITFEIIVGAPLVPEYEKVFLMEMAMSGNTAYLSKFWTDLETHRFDLIVSEPLALVTRPASDVFGEENNVWVERVAAPMAEAYRVALELPESEMALLVPRERQTVP